MKYLACLLSLFTSLASAAPCYSGAASVVGIVGQSQELVFARAGSLDGWVIHYKSGYCIAYDTAGNSYFGAKTARTIHTYDGTYQLRCDFGGGVTTYFYSYNFAVDESGPLDTRSGTGQLSCTQ